MTTAAATGLVLIQLNFVKGDSQIIIATVTLTLNPFPLLLIMSKI